MKIQVMRLGKVEASEDHVVPEYENDDAWFVCLETSTGFIVEIDERDSSFSIRSTNAAMSISNNSIAVERKE